MEVNTYNEYLIELIDNNESKIRIEPNTTIDLYMTLLSLNNSSYDYNMYKKEIELIEDFLRKINNLKIKIQLKRKEKEIQTLQENIKEIYLNNTSLIDRYNKENINIIYTIISNNTKDITNLLDKLTKEKIKRISNNDYYNQIRESLANETNKNYVVNNETIIINNNIISLSEFYEIFSYLLDIENYKDTYTDKKKNELHKQLINNIINIINNKNELNNEKIPMILTYILTKQITNYETVNTEDFMIENIKITDLYSFANNNQTNTNTAKWQKIQIPNEFLYKKLKESIFSGMYYIKDNNFIIENNISSFKTSIEITKINNFLKENLKRIDNKSA